MNVTNGALSLKRTSKATSSGMSATCTRRVSPSCSILASDVSASPRRWALLRRAASSACATAGISSLAEHRIIGTAERKLWSPRSDIETISSSAGDADRARLRWNVGGVADGFDTAYVTRITWCLVAHSMKECARISLTRAPSSRRRRSNEDEYRHRRSVSSPLRRVSSSTSKSMVLGCRSSGSTASRLNPQTNSTISSCN
mmetsp:Transcript_28719/g.88991  ORF Transcript_28719/g.88991 Transcript_28719/m.88991 type:complete len:201 (+) Transcript_28719:494-1096(+)